MGYQVALSPAARRDLRDIVRYISLDSPDRTLAFGEFLVSSAKRLADFPELGRVVPEFDDPAIREIVVRAYRVIYRVDHGDCRGYRSLLAWCTRNSRGRLIPAP